MPRKKNIQPSMRWFWFSVVIAGLPIVFRWLFYLAFGRIDGYDIRDVLFGCLGLCLGNLNLMVHLGNKRSIITREKIMIESAILACTFCLFLGIAFAIECIGKVGVHLYWVYVIMYSSVIYSLIKSYEVNRKTLRLLKKYDD